MSELAAVILAAGKGTRMNSDWPKVLHSVAGQPMLSHVLYAAETAGCNKKIVVVGFGASQVAPLVEGRAELVTQEEQLGTGHAVMQAKDSLRDFNGTVMVLCGDTPLLDGAELRNLYNHHLQSGNKATILTAVLDDATGYGRIVRSDSGQILKIVEQKDANLDELSINEVNAGIYCIESEELFTSLGKIDCNNAQCEYYLTDVVAKLISVGEKVGSMTTADKNTIMGINSRRQLAEAEKWFRQKVNYNLMDQGVTIVDPNNTYIDPTVIIGKDTVIYPFTWLEGNTIIGESCNIGPNTRLTNMTIGNNCTIQFSYAHDATIGNGVNIGPYAHIRPGTRLADDVKVGNFVEVKNSWVGMGTKLPHLSYIGDADLGSGVNMGCGTITVNYDGKKKSRTKIGDNSFVGCNSNLVAPVELFENTYIAAGSTITHDVPERALGVARARQKNIENWNKE